ncbi:MAG: hypothetical protein ACTHQQ_08495 [Solirubrobacteraceae bacterium]
MAVHTSSQVPGSQTYATYAEDEDRGYGWVAFAGTLLLILGTLNTIEGIAAIGNANAWLAAESHRCAALYRAYAHALSQEERAAAEFERCVKLVGHATPGST